MCVCALWRKKREEEEKKKKETIDESWIYMKVSYCGFSRVFCHGNFPSSRYLFVRWSREIIAAIRSVHTYTQPYVNNDEVLRDTYMNTRWQASVITGSIHSSHSWQLLGILIINQSRLSRVVFRPAITTLLASRVWFLFGESKNSSLRFKRFSRFGSMISRRCNSLRICRIVGIIAKLWEFPFHVFRENTESNLRYDWYIHFLSLFVSEWKSKFVNCKAEKSYFFFFL